MSVYQIFGNCHCLNALRVWIYDLGTLITWLSNYSKEPAVDYHSSHILCSTVYMTEDQNKISFGQNVEILKAEIFSSIKAFCNQIQQVFNQSV